MCTISVFSWTTAAFQHQRQDQGARHPPSQDQWPVSTNLSFLLPRARSRFPPPSSLLSPRHTLARSLALPLAYRYLVFRSPLILRLCLLHIPHGPLFPVRDPLRRVSPGQVLETRGFHRKSILRPLPPPLSFALVSSSLSLAASTAARSFFLYFSFVSRSLCRAKRHAFSFRMSFSSLNEGKWAREERRREPEIRRNEIKSVQFRLLRITACSDDVRHTRACPT